MLLRKKGFFGLSTLASLVLVIVLVILIVSWLVSIGVPRKLAILFGVGVDDSGNANGSSADCKVVIAKVIDEYIHFCDDVDCVNARESKLFAEGDKIVVDQKSNENIGNIVGKLKIVVLFPQIINKYGGLYDEVKEDLPSETDLINLHHSEIFGDKFCRSEKTTPEEFREERTVKNVKTADGIIYYYNLDSVLKNSLSFQNTEVYSDAGFKIKAENIFVSPYYELIKISNGKEEIIKDNAVEFSRNIRENTKIDKKIKEKEGYQIYALVQNIDNSNGQLGFSSWGDPITHAGYKIQNQKVYIKFYEFDGLNSESPWGISMDYWNAYGESAGAPDWALLKDE